MERRRPFSREGYIEKYIRACNSGEAGVHRTRSQREWIKMEVAGRRRGSSPRGEEGGRKIPASKVRTWRCGCVRARRALGMRGMYAGKRSKSLSLSLLYLEKLALK